MNSYKDSEHNIKNGLNSFSSTTNNKINFNLKNLYEIEKFLCVFAKSSNFFKIYNIIKNKK